METVKNTILSRPAQPFETAELADFIVLPRADVLNRREFMIDEDEISTI